MKIPALNEGLPWSELCVVDLTICVMRGKDAKFIAELLCRSELEVLEKAAALHLPLEWVGRNEKASRPRPATAAIVHAISGKSHSRIEAGPASRIRFARACDVARPRTDKRAVALRNQV